MEITNELLAAYAEGNVTPEERKAVREYLTEHPSQLESVMMMMDEDYGMEAKQHNMDISFLNCKSPRLRDTSIVTRAFAPSQVVNTFAEIDRCCSTPSSTFNERLDDLLNEI